MAPLALPIFQRVIFFFLWGYVKSRVYTHKPHTLNDFKEAIRQEIRPIDRHLLARVMDDFNPLNAELNPICYLLALVGAHHFLHVSRIKG